jgi:hypothetical protein
MKSNHRTQFLFIHPVNPPTALSIEDEITEKVDFIFSQLQITSGSRGFHVTPYGKMSDSDDYTHHELPIVSNSLATYYIRYHRADVSDKELKWIHELYQILHNQNYYKIKKKPVYYFKLYEKDESGYGNAMTYAVKAIGNTLGISTLLKGSFYRELSEPAFNELIKTAQDVFQHEVEGCSLVEVYDVLKKGTFIAE